MQEQHNAAQTVVAAQSLIAFNYAADSDNRIHADDVAQQYGFRGGLVPGVGDYAYLARVAQEALGDVWLETGWMQAKFVKPIYHGDRVTGRALNATAGRVGHDRSRALVDLQLVDSNGQVCSVGRAGLKGTEGQASKPWFDPATVAPLPSPETESRPPACVENLPAGLPLGSLTVPADAIAEAYLNEPSRYADTNGQERKSTALGARLHPGYVPELGNDILMYNVELGPWIHTSSQVQHLGALVPNQEIEVRAQVSDAWQNKGRDHAELRVAVWQGGRCSALLVHTAIIKLE